MLRLNEEGIRNVEIDLNNEPKFRIRKCGIAKTAVIQSIGSMD
jgi:hypothetical protein